MARYYWHPSPDGAELERFWSVTTLIDLGIPKPALKRWAARMAAEFAVENLDVVTLLVERDQKDAAVDLVKGAHERSSRQAKLKGGQVHDAIEAYELDKPYPGVPDEVRAQYDQYLRFLEAYRPVVEQSEATILNRTRKYGGRDDAVMVFTHPDLLAHPFISYDGPDAEVLAPYLYVDGKRAVRVVVDYKTGKGPGRDGRGQYPEVSLQEAAYGHGEFFEGPDKSEWPMLGVRGCGCWDCVHQGTGYTVAAILNALAGRPPEPPPPLIDGAVAVHLYEPLGKMPEVIPVDIRRAWQFFLHAYEIARWQELVAKGTVGHPVKNPPPPEEDPVVEEYVVTRPCPECGSQCERVESENPKAPRWRCPNDEGCHAGKDGRPWASWHENPWKVGGEVGPPRIPGEGQVAMDLGVQADVAPGTVVANGKAVDAPPANVDPAEPPKTGLEAALEASIEHAKQSKQAKEAGKVVPIGDGPKKARKKTTRRRASE